MIVVYWLASMNPNTKLATLLIVALGTIGTTATAFAQPSDNSGIEIADENVHTNTGGLSEQDFAFHEGLCQAGISTEALEEVTQGAGCDALDSPGESGGVRQDN